MSNQDLLVFIFASRIAIEMKFADFQDHMQLYENCILVLLSVIVIDFKPLDLS